jgi:hypothetical protein
MNPHLWFRESGREVFGLQFIHYNKNHRGYSTPIAGNFSLQKL